MKCWIWYSHIGAYRYEGYDILTCNEMWFVRNPPTFLTNVQRPSSGSKSGLRKTSAISRLPTFHARLVLRPWRLKWCIALKHLRTSNELHFVTSQKIIVLMLMKTEITRQISSYSSCAEYRRSHCVTQKTKRGDEWEDMTSLLGFTRIPLTEQVTRNGRF
jgi:hypothetical protein